MKLDVYLYLALDCYNSSTSAQSCFNNEQYHTEVHLEINKELCPMDCIFSCQFVNPPVFRMIFKPFSTHIYFKVSLNIQLELSRGVVPIIFCLISWNKAASSACTSMRLAVYLKSVFYYHRLFYLNRFWIGFFLLYI